MADDVRYSELRFLQSLSKGTSEIFNHQDPKNAENAGLNPRIFMEMVLTTIEELYVEIDDQNAQLLVGKLRGEATTIRGRILLSDWENHRDLDWRTAEAT